LTALRVFFKSPFFLILLTFYCLGLIQVFSSSYFLAQETFDHGFFYFFRQAIFILLGLSLAFCVYFFKGHFFEKYGWLLWLGSCILVLLTLVPGFGVKVGGASRWLSLGGGFRVEPSEFLKLGFCFWLASLFDPQRTKGFSKIPWYGKFFLTLLPFVLLLFQPDFGSFAVLVLLFISTVFVMGLKLKWFLMTAGFVLPLFYFLVMTVEYRKQRVLSYLDPWLDPQGRGYQVIQSMATFSRGGWWGEGFGQSQGKLFFLPEAHTDFTFAIFGEEWGFLGVVGLLSLYFLIPFFGFKKIKSFPLGYPQILGFCCLMMVTLSALINMGVSLGLLPTKGLTLPFLSYGGSSLMMLSLAFGLLIRYERQSSL
jgi:cell division protein FtsW